MFLVTCADAIALVAAEQAPTSIAGGLLEQIDGGEIEDITLGRWRRPAAEQRRTTPGAGHGAGDPRSPRSDRAGRRGHPPEAPARRRRLRGVHVPAGSRARDQAAPPPSTVAQPRLESLTRRRRRKRTTIA